MSWTADGPTGHESAKIAPLIVPYTRGRGLDLGAGNSKAYPHFLSVDNGKVYGDSQADIPGDIRDLSMFATDSLDFAFSSHALEDLEDTRQALTEWWRVVKPGGHLVLYLPDARAYPRMGQPGANPHHKHDFLPSDILDHMREVAKDSGAVVVEDEARHEGIEYSFFQAFVKSSDGKFVYKPWRKRMNSLLLIRYGGFGDGYVLSSALPLLKKQGWHITVNTTPRGRSVIEADPNIDEWIIQDEGQVPHGCLVPVWYVVSQRYDRTINLSASVETWLLPDRHDPKFWLPHDIRHAMLNVNYYEHTHRLCGVDPSSPRAYHYSTASEKEWAAAQHREWGDAPLCMIVVVGSSVNKSYPFYHQAARQIAAAIPRSRIVVVGDPTWEEVYRETFKGIGQAVSTLGRWNIRQTMAMAERCKVVIGPETGVLNGMSGNDEVRKIVLLSHSSHENLTKHFRNTVALFEPKISCYPCHRLHHDALGCKIEPESGCAICQVAINPLRISEPAIEALRGAARLEAAE